MAMVDQKAGKVTLERRSPIWRSANLEDELTNIEDETKVSHIY